MEEHVEIYCMMKEDTFYDKDALREHGLSGLEDERLYHDLMRYAIMLDNAVYWLKKLEKSEREEREAERARERALFRELLNRVGRSNGYHERSRYSA
jgi:hypothetical protein